MFVNPCVTIGLDEHHGILDDRVDDKIVFILAADSFMDVHSRRDSKSYEELRLRRDTDGIDDQRAAFPMADGMPRERGHQVSERGVAAA